MQINAGKLRLMQKEDLRKILHWRNSERIRKNMFTDHIISEEEHLTWFNSFNREKNTYLIFEFNNRPVGMVYFTDIDKYNSKCYWGFYLGETGLPKGTGLLMGSLGLEFAFNDLKIRKLCSEAFAFNESSIKFHKKLGFIQEGYLVEHIKKDGCYEDVIVFTLFNKK